MNEFERDIQEPDEQCPHEWQKLFDGWEDTHEVGDLSLHLNRVCELCGDEEDHELTPCKESKFLDVFVELKQNEGEEIPEDATELRKIVDCPDDEVIDFVTLEMDDEYTEGFDAYARIAVYLEGTYEPKVLPEVYHFYL